MDVEDDIVTGKQFRFQEMGEPTGRRARRIARERAVEVAAVQRRAVLGGHNRRRIRHRQDCDATADCGRIEPADQLGQRQLALILVAVVASHQQQ